MSPADIEPHALLGTWRRFGPVGPVYEIIGFEKPGATGEPRMRIRVVETGEETPYRLADLLADPQET